MYTKIQQDECIACGLCQLKAPAIFDYNAEGIAFCKLDDNKGTAEIPVDLLPNFKTAAQKCPTGAIKHQAHPF